MAPELGTSPATLASDMFAFGRTLQVATLHVHSTQVEDLLLRLTVDKPESRPTAEEAESHPYFVEFWAWRREKRCRCAICLDEDIPAEGGLECANPGGPHFVCNGCLAKHVRNESQMELRLLAARVGLELCCHVRS